MTTLSLAGISLRYTRSSRRSVLGLSALLLISVLSLSGCNEPEGPSKPNRWQWKPDATHTCSKIGTHKYCFFNKDIVATSQNSDYSAGFLLAVPIGSDINLSECNYDDTRLNGRDGPSGGMYISLSFGDIQQTDTFDRYYERAYNLTSGKLADSDIKLGPPVLVFGRKCAYTTISNLTHKDFICHNGSLKNGGLASILSCRKKGLVGQDGYPNPGCDDNLYTAKSHYKISYNRKCLLYVDRIRSLVLNYVEMARARAEDQ